MHHQEIASILFAHVGVFICVWVHMLMCTYEGQRSTLTVFLSCSSFIFRGKASLSLTWNSPNGLGWLANQVAPGICCWVWVSPYQCFKNGFCGLNPIFCTLLTELSPQTKRWLLMWRLRALGLGWYWNVVKNAASFLSELSDLWKKSTALSSTLWHSFCARTVIFGFQSS